MSLFMDSEMLILDCVFEQQPEEEEVMAKIKGNSKKWYHF